VYLRPARHDLELVALGACSDENTLESEDLQKVDKVRLHETQATQIRQLICSEGQRAQVIELLVHLARQLAQRIGALVAADEGVFGLRLGVPVQHGLPHRELVQVCV